MNIKFTELFKNIRKNAINFISISAFIFLGTTLFQGLNYAGHAIQGSIDKTYKEMNSYDVKLRIGGLATQEDLNRICEIDGVDKIEGFYSTNDDFTLNEETHNCSVESITNNISKLYIWEGTLPSNDNEIAIIKRNADTYNLHIGDQITFERENPMYFVQTISRDYKTTDLSDVVNENLTNFKNQTFTISAIVSQTEHLNHNHIGRGIDMVKGDNVEFNFYVNYSAFNPYMTGERFNSAYIINNELNKLSFTDKKYKKDILDLSKKIETYIKENLDFSIDYETLFDENDNLIKSTALALLSVGSISYEEYLNITTNKESVLEYGRMLAKYDGLTILTTKEHLASSLFSYTLYNLFANEKWACGGTFFVVSVLICYSVVKRLVNKDIKLIGTKKALGFTTKEISLTYLGFSIVSVLIGFILGAGLAVALEGVFVKASLKNSYSVLYFVSYFEPINTILILVTLLVLISLITILSCRNVLNKKATALLSGDINVSKNKETAFEKTRMFKKSSIMNKTIIRNFKNNINHVVATIIGISSSVALLMAALTLKVSINDSFDKQNKMFIYDTTIYVDSDVDNSIDNIKYYLKDNNIPYTPVKQEAVTFSFDDNESLLGNIVVYFDNDTFSNLFKIEESNDKVTFNNTGFWFPESYQKAYSLKEDCTANLKSSSGLNINVNPSGYFKFYYFEGLILVDQNTYKEVTNREVKPDSLLVARGDKDFNEFKQEIRTISGYKSVKDNISTKESNIKAFNSISTIVFILFTTATILLSFFVILNLLVTKIEENKREIITLIINGYSRKQAKKYVYIDTIILTVISLFLGLVIGLGLAAFTRSSLESENLYLLHNINPIVIGVSIAGTILLVILMSLISLRKISKFKLKDIQE